jgi:hypothetical protein
MKSAVSNLDTSSFTAFCLSGPIFFFFCRTGLAFGMMCSLCSDISRGIPGISDGDQAKNSLCNRKKFTNLSQATPYMALPMFTVLPSAIFTCSISSIGSTVDCDSRSLGSLCSFASTWLTWAPRPFKDRT